MQQILLCRGVPVAWPLDESRDWALDVDALYRHRRGVWFDDGQPGRVRVTWSHMQTDGVGIWSALLVWVTLRAAVNHRRARRIVLAT